MRSELNARFDTEERTFLKQYAQQNGVSEAAALRMLVRRLMPQKIHVQFVETKRDPVKVTPDHVQVVRTKREPIKVAPDAVRMFETTRNPKPASKPERKRPSSRS